MIDWFATNFIILYAILYGVTMKIADLFDEHGLKEWFKGSKILFGFLEGIFGALLIVAHPVIGIIVLAATISFLLRNRLDYLNHQIAAAIIIIFFILYGNFNLLIFIIFFLVYYIFGSLKDYLDDKKKLKKGFVPKFVELAPYGPIATFIFSLITKDWIVFISWTVTVIVYDLIKYSYRKKGYN